MIIKLNEREIEIDFGLTIADIMSDFNINADIFILNSFPVKKDTPLSDGDRLVLIKRGEIPSKKEAGELLTARNTPDTFEKLQNAKVAIAGLGGLGSNAAVSLARAGIGTLKLVDYDIVEPSNLNRQHYFYNQIGMKKTTALKEIIESITPLTNVITEDIFISGGNIKTIFAGYDIIIEALDNAELKADFIEVALSRFKFAFIIGASGIAGSFDTSLFKERHITDRCVIVGDFKNEVKQHQGLSAPRVAAAANIQANIAIRKIIYG